MESAKRPVFDIRDLNFFYPDQTEKALDSVSFSVPRGQFVTLCGPSGCGKTTLLRQLKPVLSPHGFRTGEILFDGRPLSQISPREQTAGIGFVLQSPENQIVTDKVWHELAFGLESLGYDTPSIRGRVAEMASFFGIQDWFYKNVTELSGGQKQLLCLASIMAMQPDVLILDEPTSQLDPIAAADFLATVGRINRELGTTVLLTEHRLEEVFPLSDRVLVMDRGRVVCDGAPRDVGARLRDMGHAMFLAMPAPMRIYAAVPSTLPCPVTVRDGRDWLDAYAAEHTLRPDAFGEDAEAAETGAAEADDVLRFEDVWFKYEKTAPDVIRGLTLSVRRGEFLALLGGNGTGKTTMLSLIAGLNRPYRGKLRVADRVGMLPQNPQALFVKKTVAEDLHEILKDQPLSKAEKDRKVASAARLCRLEPLLSRHPYDLSGGEQQRAALAKVLLLNPGLLLLDEPTKGLDAEFKQVFAAILCALLRRGVTVVMVSHDIEFCAEYAERCALFFDGGVVTDGAPRAFFPGNSFYTTAANRMARCRLPGAVTAADIIFACGGTPPPPPQLPPDDGAWGPAGPAENTRSKEAGRLPLWRRLLAGLSSAAALAVFLHVIGRIDLTRLLGTGYGVYASLIGTLFVLAAAVSRKSDRPIEHAQRERGRRKLARRTIIATGLILLLIPVTIFVGTFYLADKKYYFISLLVLLETMLPFFLIFEGRKPQARELVIIAVLCALGVAGRAALSMLPQFKPVMAITIIAGVAFGGETGFLVGAMTMLASNVLLTQGPWTPWQMFAMGIIGFLAGVLFRKGLLRRDRLSLSVFGALSAFLIYGGIMNPAAALMWQHTVNWKILLAYYASGLPMDSVQAAATALFLWFLSRPMLEKLDRVKTKYGLVEA